MYRVAGRRLTSVGLEWKTWSLMASGISPQEGRPVMATKPVLTQGKGSANMQLQDCPPDYHFELSKDELIAAIDNPQQLAQTLNIPTLGRIRTIVISYPEPTQVLRAPTTYCCKPCLSESVC
jgi:hypothetical protein